MKSGYRIVGWALGVTMGIAAWDQAAAAIFSDQYLLGRWTTGDTAGCSKPEHEQTLFRDDGTFTTEHAGKALAVGFWQVTEDRLTMQILTTEASLAPTLQDALPGDYHMLQVRGLAFDIADDGFRMVQSVGDDLQGVNMVRCPAT